MTNMDYEVGLIKAQNEALKEDVDRLNQTISEMQKDLKDIKTEITTWKAQATGAAAVIIPILTAVGAIVLWLGDNLLQIIKVKIGW